MIDVIIASYKEPKSTLRAVNIFLKSKRKDLRVTVVDPFTEVEKFLRGKIKDKRFNFFLDPGEGKSYALNLLFQELGSSNTDDFFILTDGDVYVSDNAIDEIVNAFKDKEIGCVTGHPISLDSKDTKYGYWQNLAFERIHQVRERMSNNKQFFECSGYLFAIRKGVILDFPLETSEDSIIPFLFWKKGYKINYLPNAAVYVKNPDNWKDWLAQKVRNIKAHEKLNKIVPDMPRTKTLWNEIKEGTFYTLANINSLKQLFWVLQYFPARLYLYLKAFSQLKKKRSYEDGWRGQATTDSTKTLD